MRHGAGRFEARCVSSRNLSYKRSILGRTSPTVIHPFIQQRRNLLVRDRRRWDDDLKIAASFPND